MVYKNTGTSPQRIKYGRVFRSVAAATVFISSAYFGNYLAIQTHYEKVENSEQSTSQAIRKVLSRTVYGTQDELNRIETFTKLAKTYDQRIKEPYVIQKRREMQIKNAYGNILECGAGTCRNTQLYLNNPKVSSVTYFDASPAMLYNGLCKTLQSQRNSTCADSTNLPSYIAVLYDGAKPSQETFCAAWNVKKDGSAIPTLPLHSNPQQSCSKQISSIVIPVTSTDSTIKGSSSVDSCITDTTDTGFTIPQMYLVNNVAKLEEVPSNTFDTVVDTYGLCAYTEPVKVLQEMQRICRPDGIILLLEHGYTPQYCISWIRQHVIRRHLQRWGCNHLQPIEQYVKDAGLRVIQFDRFGLLGSEYYIEASPNHTMQQQDK